MKDKMPLHELLATDSAPITEDRAAEKNFRPKKEQVVPNPGRIERLLKRRKISLPKGITVIGETDRTDFEKRPRAMVKYQTEDGRHHWMRRAHFVIWCRDGKPVRKGMQVHHLDNNTRNDAPDNLEALSLSKHRAAHNMKKLTKKS